jgi:hypothetical protein
VVGAEERVESELLAASRDGEQVVVRGTLLRLGEHPEIHGASIPSGPPFQAGPDGNPLRAGPSLGGVMREAIGWLIEQACRLADPEVCRLANLTDGGGVEGVDR